MKIDRQSLPTQQNRQTRGPNDVKLPTADPSAKRFTGSPRLNALWLRETKYLLVLFFITATSHAQIPAPIAQNANPPSIRPPSIRPPNTAAQSRSVQQPPSFQQSPSFQVPSRQFPTGQTLSGQTPAANNATLATDSIAIKTADAPTVRSQPEAVAQITQVIDRIVNGDAYDAKVRQRVWTAGREMVGVGTYEQAGKGSGWFSLQITMLDGDGKHTLHQISDGRLAWTRSQINEKISLRRVDVGRLKEWVPQSRRVQRAPFYVPPQFKVGGWAEMLDTIQRDYILSSAVGRVQSARKDVAGNQLLVISGKLSDAARDRIKTDSRVKKLPELFPTRVKVAIALEPNPETNFGHGLPVRLEYWSDPVEDKKATSEAAPLAGRLISLIEIYSIRPISPPPIERFRFENQDSSINFVNETDRYLKRYNIRLTDKQRKQLLR